MLGRFRDVLSHEQEAAVGLNPSAWSERVVILLLAAAGFVIASYLALYQLQVIPHVWDPLFRNGSRKVLHSPISRMLPVPDASLGAAGYLAEFVTGAIGGAERWRRLPWVVLAYGAIVAAAAVAAAVLAISQPLLVHAGCTLCLVSAAISLIIAWLARSEIFASVAHLRNPD